MKPSRIIPTCLLLASIPLSAASISVNFGADRSGSTVDDPTKTTGAIPLAGDLWNNTTVNGSGSLGSLIDDSGTATGASVDWTANNTWQSGSGGETATSENGDLTKGYFDDGGGWTVDLASPYLLNDIYIIHSTDQSNPATMSAVAVNGTYYKGDGAGGTILASGSGDSWSAANWSAADTLIESDNYIKVLAQAGVNLVALNSSPGRAAIAGVQVEDAYTGTLSYWDTNGVTPGSGDAGGTWGTDTFWSTSADGDLATAAWNVGDAAVFSAGADGTGSNTVTVSGTQVADAIWVQEGDITLTGGIVDLSAGLGLLRSDDFGLIVDSQVDAVNLTTTGDVELNSATNNITGTVTILGDTILTANNTFGQLAGGGTLDIEGNTLTVGDATDSFGPSLFGDVGSALVKTGTGTLTMGDSLDTLDALTISGGGLTLTGGGNALWTLSGAGTLSKIGGGTLAIDSTANTGFTGKTVVGGGILRIPDQTTLGTTPLSVVADSITLSGGAKIQGGDSAGGSDLTLDANRGIMIDGGGGFHTWTGFTTTVDGDISGTGTLTSHDGGTLIINGDVDVTGALHTNSNQPSATTYNSSSLIADGGFDLRAGSTTLNVGTATLEDIELGNATSQSHDLVHVAGDIDVTNDIRIAHWGSETSTYTMQGGSLTQPDTVTNPTDEAQANLFLGISGTAMFYLEDGVLTTTSMVLDGRGNTAGDDIFAMTGGTLNMGKWGIRSGNTGGTYLIQLGGGTVAATADWSSGLNMELTGTNGDVTIDSDVNTISLSGVLSGAGGFVKTGSGTLALSGATGSYAGATQINAGTLQVGSDATGTSAVTIGATGSIEAGTAGTPGTGTVETLDLASGSTSTFRVGGDVDDNITVFASDGLTATSTHTVTVLPVGALTTGDLIPLFSYTGAIQGAGFAGFGLGTFPNPHYTLSLADTVGSVDLSVDAIVEIAWAGTPGTTWDLATSANWDDGAASAFYDLDIANFNDLDPTESVVVDTSLGAITPAAMMFNNTTLSTYTVSGDAISGVGGLTKTSDGTVIITNDNTYTGLTDVQDGILQIGDGGTTGSIVSATDLSGGSAQLVFDRSDEISYGGLISGAGSVIKKGANTLNINHNSNTFSGGLTVEEGRVNLNAAKWGAGSYPQGKGNALVMAGAILANTKVHAWGGSGVPQTDLTLELGSQFQTVETTYVRDITMTGASINQGTGSGGFTGSYWGGTDINVLASTTQSVIETPFHTVNGTHRIDVADEATLTNDLLFSGVIGGAATIVKDGDGTLLSTAANTHGGPLNINAGTFALSATGTHQSSSKITVAAGATLDVTAHAGGYNIPAAQTIAGNGTVDGSIDVDGTMAPGASAGTLTVTGDLTFGEGSVYNWEISDWTGAAGTGFDTIVADSINVTATSLNRFTVVITEDTLVNFDEVDTSFVIATTTSGVTYDPFVVVVDDSAFSGFGSWALAIDGNDLVLEYTGAPDYETWATSFGLDPNTDGARGFDADVDTLVNEDEYAFGLDPSDPNSVNPYSVPLDPTTGTFRYTRRDPALTGYTYAIERSSNLTSWANDTGATIGQSVVGTVGDVQTVEVTLSGPLGDKTFARVRYTVPVL